MGLRVKGLNMSTSQHPGTSTDMRAVMTTLASVGGPGVTQQVKRHT
jgi:UDP-N-acetylglucosamine enolpyruvyl transferase